MSPAKHWSRSLQIAPSMANMRPYSTSDESLLSPAMMGHGEAAECDMELGLDQALKRAENAGIAHLAVVADEVLKQFYEKAKLKRGRILQQFERIYHSRNEATRRRLQRQYDDRKEECTRGSYVRVHRDRGKKVAVKWSGPRLV